MNQDRSKLPSHRLRRIVVRAAWIVFAILVAIQLVPYGRDHSNPPGGTEPAWDSPATRELAVRACFDCHSNQVRWPWYSHVAPASWLVQHDVEEARRHLNFSQWQKPQRHADDAAEQVAEGEMPPWNYLLLHPEARLGGPESQALIAGLESTFGRGGAGSGASGDEDHDGEGHGDEDHDHGDDDHDD